MTRPDAAAGEDGFTLIELLVAMTLSIIVLFATLQALDLFSQNAARQTKVTFANDRARASIDNLVDDLRGASTIRRAQAADLVYSAATITGGTTGVTGTTGQRTVRLCVAGVTLYRSESTTATTPTATCGTAETGWTQGAVATLPAATTTAFTYDGAASSAAPATVRTVGLTFDVDATAAGKTARSTLRAGSTLRRTSGQLAIGGGGGNPLPVTCNSSGALISLDAAATSGLSIAGVTYTSSTGAALGAGLGSVQLPKGLTNVVATITDTAGISTVIQKLITCG